MDGVEHRGGHRKETAIDPRNPWRYACLNCGSTNIRPTGRGGQLPQGMRHNVGHLTESEIADLRRTRARCDRCGTIRYYVRDREESERVEVEAIV